MLSLSQIEQKISALKTRYAELDEKLVPKRNGIIDGSVSTAMGAVTSEIARLEGLREKALVSDLLGDNAPDQQDTPKPIISTPRSAQLLRPLFATKDPDVTDPLVGLENLPIDEKERKELVFETHRLLIEKINEDLERRQKAAGQDIAVAFTQGFFKSLIVTLGMMTAEARWLVAMGRDRRKSLEEKLLKRIEALEARPVITDAGVWDQFKTYSAGALVSHQGGGWIAQVESKGVRPGDGALWRLAIQPAKESNDNDRRGRGKNSETIVGAGQARAIELRHQH